MKRIDSEGQSYALTRSEKRQTQKAEFDSQREIYLGEFRDFRGNAAALLEAEIVHDFNQAELARITSGFSTTGAAQGLRIDKVTQDLAFLNKEVLDLEKNKKAHPAKTRFDNRLRSMGFVGAVLAENLLYPSEFMQRQLMEVEAVRSNLIQLQTTTQAENQMVVGAIEARVESASREIYRIESQWVFEGDINRFVNYAIDHPQHKEALFASYLKAHPENRQAVYDLFTKYSVLVGWVEPIKRELPEVAPAPKPKVIRPKARPIIDEESSFDWQAWFDDYTELRTEESEVTTEDVSRFFMVTGLNRAPILVENSDQIDDGLPNDIDRITGETIWKELSIINSFLKEDPIRVSQHYREMVKGGTFNGWRKTGIGRRWRLIFHVTSDSEVLFRVGDHQEVLGVWRKIRG